MSLELVHTYNSQEGIGAASEDRYKARDLGEGVTAASLGWEGLDKACRGLMLVSSWTTDRQQTGGCGRSARVRK